MTLEDAIVHAEEAASDYEGMIKESYYDSEKLAKCANEQRQIAAWLKELVERRKADSCDGCCHDVNGYKCASACSECRRSYGDKYEAERRTDEMQ